MPPHHRKTPLRAEAGSDQRDPVVTQRAPQIVDVVGKLFDSVAPQINTLPGKLRYGGARQISVGGGEAGQTGLLVERLFRHAIFKLQNVAALAESPLIHKHHVSNTLVFGDVLYPARELPIALVQSRQKGIAGAAWQMKRRRRARRLRGSEARKAHADNAAVRVGAIFGHIQRTQLEVNGAGLRRGQSRRFDEDFASLALGARVSLDRRPFAPRDRVADVLDRARHFDRRLDRPPVGDFHYSIVSDQFDQNHYRIAGHAARDLFLFERAKEKPCDLLTLLFQSEGSLTISGPGLPRDGENPGPGNIAGLSAETGGDEKLIDQPSQKGWQQTLLHGLPPLSKFRRPVRTTS